MPSTIDNLPQSIIDPLDQMEPSKAKVKVMTADIQRRALDNQEMLGIIKDPKALDKRDSKKYADLQKSKETLDGFLAKKGQLYAQKKELKDKIPQLVKELETQKENFKIYKQKDKVTAAEKALKTAQADYTKVRKDLTVLDQKIKEKQIVFSNDLLTLRKAITVKAPPRPSTQPLYPEATRQKISDIFKSLPPDMRAKLTDVHQDYENVMSDSALFHDKVLALMGQIAESKEIETTPHLEALKMLLAEEKSAISTDSTRKERAAKILNERVSKQWQAYESNFDERLRVLSEIQTYKESEDFYMVLHELQPLLVASVNLFSPRASFYEDILKLLTEAHPKSEPPSLMGRMPEANTSTLVQDIQKLVDAEKKYLTGDLCAQKLKAKVENHYMDHLISEDNRLYQGERLKADQEILMLFDQALEMIQNDTSTNIYNKIYALEPLIRFQNVYFATASPNPFYYKAVKESFEKVMKDYNNPYYPFAFDLQQQIDFLPNKGVFIKTGIELSTNDLLLAPKIQRERAQLRLHHMKQQNPAWAQNITFIEKSILPKLNGDQKQALKDLLRAYPIQNSPLLMRFMLDYDPHLDQRIHDYVTKWSQTKNANPEVFILGLKQIVSQYDLDLRRTWTNDASWLVTYANSMPLFEEDMPSGLPNSLQ